MRQKAIYSLVFAVLGALFFLPFLGGVHLFDWDEINFAEISREMLLLEDYLRIHVNFEPFWEKPPLFFWFQAMAMKLFGVNEYAARFPNAICGIITLVLLYRMGHTLQNHRFGVLWAGTYLGSILPHLYFKSGILDPWFNLFIFLGLYGLIVYYWKKEGKATQFHRNRFVYLVSGGLFLGLAVLIKGPTAILIAGLCCVVYWVSKRFQWFVSLPKGILYLVAALVPPLIWIGVETAAHGSWFSVEFTRYQYRLFSTPDAGHAGFPGYHFVVLLLGCFPASIFAIRGMGLGKYGDFQDRDFWRWMMILFWVVLVLFTIVKSKIVHYSSMAYFPLTYLAAMSLDRLLDDSDRLTAWMKALLGFIAGVAVIASLALPILGQRAEALKPLFIGDAFAQANLEAAVQWDYWALIPGLILLGAVIGFFIWWKKQNRSRATLWLFGGGSLYVMLALIFFIKRIEGYSQRAAVEFYQAHQQEDCYVMTFGFKSYAHIFYLDKQIPPDYDPDYVPEVGQMSFQALKTANPGWLLKGDIDKDVYVVGKIKHLPRLREMQQLEEIGQKNGFVFFKREKED
ncbi:MAG: glycosyltransferase family 39 protein [Bacteroidota bacterium]